MIYDTHAHLDYIKNLDDVLKNSKSENISKIITNSVNMKSCQRNLEIKKSNPELVLLAAGLYPEETLKESDFLELERFVNENLSEISALGEIGLDFSQEKPSKEIQEKVFIKELELARELALPVIIHTRKAETRVLEILEDFKDLKIILHCFSGKFNLIKRANKLGFHFSIPTSIVRSEHFQKMISELLPKEKILTETDSPYLSPFKEFPNKPSNINESIKIISKIWNLSTEETEKVIQKNFERIFTTI